MGQLLPDILTGLRIAGIVIFTWLAWRVLFDSWQVTEGALANRRRAMRSFRAHVLVVCALVVLLASPADILEVNGYITPVTAFHMMLGVAVLGIVSGTLVHHALDVADDNRPATWVACILIAALSLAFGVGAGV